MAAVTICSDLGAQENKLYLEKLYLETFLRDYITKYVFLLIAYFNSFAAS